MDIFKTFLNQRNSLFIFHQEILSFKNHLISSSIIAIHNFEHEISILNNQNVEEFQISLIFN